MQLADQLAKVSALQCIPLGDVFALAVSQQLVQVAAVAVQRVPRQLPGAAQVFEVGVEFVLHEQAPASGREQARVVRGVGRQLRSAYRAQRRTEARQHAGQHFGDITEEQRAQRDLVVLWIRRSEANTSELQ